VRSGRAGRRTQGGPSPGRHRYRGNRIDSSTGTAGLRMKLDQPLTLLLIRITVTRWSGYTLFKEPKPPGMPPAWAMKPRPEDSRPMTQP